ncbi:MAG TPA: DUF4390 domain-containing protein [Steroidobacteraceae bacterium]|nr:DUF4390 domain-containing protein [Steroidobacteraceae bacterium]
MADDLRQHFNRIRCRWARCGGVAFTLFLMLVTGTARATDNELTIQGANIDMQNGVYLLDAQLVFNLPDSAEKAVREGVTMNLELQIRFDHVRRLWLDETVAELDQRYALIYHSVSERFLLRNVNSGAQSSFATFADAVAALKNIHNLPLIDSSLLQPQVRNEISVRASVDIRSIPRALGLLLFWVDDFSLKSDWYTWPIKTQSPDAE